jgi:hypothetical protein
MHLLLTIDPTGSPVTRGEPPKALPPHCPWRLPLGEDHTGLQLPHD